MSHIEVVVIQNRVGAPAAPPQAPATPAAIAATPTARPNKQHIYITPSLPTASINKAVAIVDAKILQALF